MEGEGRRERRYIIYEEERGNGRRRRCRFRRGKALKGDMD